MPQKTPTAVDLFAAPNETQQEIIEFIDDALERGVGGDEIEDTIADKYRGSRRLRDAVSPMAVFSD